MWKKESNLRMHCRWIWRLSSRLIIWSEKSEKNPSDFLRAWADFFTFLVLSKQQLKTKRHSVYYHRSLKNPKKITKAGMTLIFLHFLLNHLFTQWLQSFLLTGWTALISRFPSKCSTDVNRTSRKSAEGNVNEYMFPSRTVMWILIHGHIEINNWRPRSSQVP